MVKSSRVFLFALALLVASAAILSISGLGSKLVSAATSWGTVSSNEHTPTDIESPMDEVGISDFATAVTQNFDSLPSTGTGLAASTLPTGWSFSKSDSGTTYAADAGGTVSSNIYSYGAADATDRALGALDDSSMVGTFGAIFKNNTGRQIKALQISYTGEQWRRGGATNLNDTLSFSYCTNCNSLTQGTWTSVSDLNFVSPNQGTNSNQVDRAVNGNQNSNKAAKSATITVSLNNNATIRIRWVGQNNTGADDGLSIDDFSIRAIPTVPETSLTANPASISSSTSASFSFSSDDAAATFECSLDGAAYAACTSPRSLTGLSEGSHTFNVRATSGTGTDGSPVSYTWTVDSVAPTASFSNALSGFRNTTSESLAFSASDASSGVARIECSLNNATFATCESPVSLTGLSQGSQSFRIRAVDNAGNTSTIASSSWTVDSVAPTVGTVPVLGNTTNVGTRNVDFQVTDTNSISAVALFSSVTSPSSSAGDGKNSTTTEFSSNLCSIQNVNNNTYRCVVPSAIAGSVVSYYVTATDAATNTRRVPSLGAYSYVVQSASGQTDLPGGTYGSLTLDSTFNIAGDITVTNGLTLTGPIEAGSNVVTFGCDASVSGTGFIVGSVNKEFCGASSFTYPIGVNEPGVNFNGEVEGEQGATLPVYAPATITVLSVTGPSSVTIDAFVGQLTGVAPTHYTGIYWSTKETGDITADLRFGWDAAAEVGNSVYYSAIRRSSTTEVVTGTVSTLGRFVDFPSVSQFDSPAIPLTDGPMGIIPSTVPYYWTAALIGTTAGRNELSGKVTSAEGLPLRGVAVTLIGGDLSEPVTVRTNQFGVYNFSGLEAGSTYVVNVNSGRYTFSNNSKIVYLADSITNENFVADRR